MAGLVQHRSRQLGRAQVTLRSMRSTQGNFVTSELSRATDSAGASSHPTAPLPGGLADERPRRAGVDL